MRVGYDASLACQFAICDRREIAGGWSDQFRLLPLCCEESSSIRGGGSARFVGNGLWCWAVKFCSGQIETIEPHQTQNDEFPVL